MKKTPSNLMTLDDSAKLFKAFADPVRLRLLHLLSGDREVCVCHLHETLGLPQPTVSRHLAYLRTHGLVTGRKQGLWVYYRLAPPQSSLHRTLLEGLGSGLSDLNIVREDQRRLARIVSSCGDGL